MAGICFFRISLWTRRRSRSSVSARAFTHGGSLPQGNRPVKRQTEAGKEGRRRKKERTHSRIIAYYCFLLAVRSRFPREHAALILNRRAITLARQHCWNMAMPGTGLPAFDGLRIPMKADTCSNPCRTPFRSCRTPFQWCPKTVRHQPGTLSDTNRNGVRLKSECCPTEIGISVRQPSEYAGPAFMRRAVYNPMIYSLLRIFLDKARV